MKCLFIGLLFVMFTTSSVFALQGGVPTSSSLGNGISPIQTTVPDRLKSQVTTAMTGTVVFYFTGGGRVGNVVIDNWYNIHLYPATSDMTYYYNADSTKTFICPASQMCNIFVNQPDITSVTVTFGSGTNYVQGM